MDDGLLFKGNRLFIPRCSIHALLIKEVHDGSLVGHYEIQKTLSMLQEHYFWPKMISDVIKALARCGTCYSSKLSFHKGEYKPLPVAEMPWEDVYMDFVVALPRTQRGKDSIMVVVDRFPKMAHFVARTKVNDAKAISSLYFKGIVRLHGIPRTIVSDCDPKFLSTFWGSLWRLLDTKLHFD